MTKFSGLAQKRLVKQSICLLAAGLLLQHKKI